ncbi:Nucleoid occlusion protein [compost metagenome]
MKSNDYPGKPKAGIKGLRRPADLTEPSVSVSRSAMLEQTKSGDSNEVVSAPQIHVGEVILKGESWMDEIPVDLIDVSPYQPRIRFDETKLEELAASIQTLGLGKPILVRPKCNGRFELIGGERRWRASKMIGKKTILAVVRIVDDNLAMILAFTDNEQEDLLGYEKARSIHRMLTEGEGMSQRSLARQLGVNVSTISRYLLLIELPEDLRLILDDHPDLISMAYAKEFVEYAKDHPDEVKGVLHEMTVKELSQEQALRLIGKRVAEKKGEGTNRNPTPRKLDGFGSLEIKGNRISIKCDKKLSATLLAKKFEEFLKSIDPREVTGEQ